MDDDKTHQIIKFLSFKSRPELRTKALEILLGLSASDDGKAYLLDNNEIVEVICSIPCAENEDLSIVSEALTLILNLSCDTKFCDLILQKLVKIISHLYTTMIELKDKKLSDISCKILCNISRDYDHCLQTWQHLTKIDGYADNISIIVRVIDLFEKTFVSTEYHGFFAYTTSLLLNLTQLHVVRNLLKNDGFSTLKRLLPYLKPKTATLHRMGIIGVVRNCCFDAESHSKLLEDDLELIPALLMPLAGNEEFSEKENDQLPIDLQYLPEDKTREEDPSIRKMLIEAFMQLCATKDGRQHLRDRGVYYIMRELFNWEKNKEVEIACHNLIDVLIKEEHEINIDNLKNLDIPDKMAQEFDDIDRELL